MHDNIIYIVFSVEFNILLMTISGSVHHILTNLFLADSIFSLFDSSNELIKGIKTEIRE